MLGLVVALCLGIIGFLVRLGPEYPSKMAPSIGPDTVSRESGVPGAGGLAPAQRASKIKALAVYWERHKDHLRQIVTVDYPAALARRKAVVPDADSVGKFGEKVYFDYYEIHRAAAKHTEALAREESNEMRVADSKLSDLRKCLALGRALSDNTVVNDHLTISRLANQTLDDPAYLTELGQNLVDVERQVYGDQDAAKTLQGAWSREKLMDYLQTALARYAETDQETTLAAGYDQTAYDFKTGMAYSTEVFGLASLYKGKIEPELWQLFAAYGKEAAALDVQLLAEASRDDAESRRLLTDIKEMQTRAESIFGDRFKGQPVSSVPESE